MDKIKEKPQATSSIREKITAAPKELVHRGLEDGTNHLRTQLRDAAQQGRRDDYGGDQIEDTAAGGIAPHGARCGKAHQREAEEPCSRDGSSADSTAVDPVPEIRTRSMKAVSTPQRQTSQRNRSEKPGSGSRPRTHTCALKRKRRFPACHQSAPRASSPSSGSADGRRRRDPRRTKPSGCGSRQAAAGACSACERLPASRQNCAWEWGQAGRDCIVHAAKGRAYQGAPVRCQKGEKTERLP